MNIKLEKEYLVTYKSCFFNRTLRTSASVENVRDKIEDSNKKSILKDFYKFNLSIFDVSSSAYLFFQRSQGIIHNFYGRLTKVVSDNNEVFFVFEIIDICLKDAYRARGIGGQLLKILDKIAQINNIRYIIGELEEDEDMEKRKRFFEKNGYKLFQNPDFKLSGWGICKSFNKDN